MFNPNLERHTQALADYMPNGRLFEAKNVQDSNFRQLLRGLAGELFTAQGYLVTLEKEYFPDTTTLFIEEWESAVAIPDDCFTGDGTIVERRRDIVAKLVTMSVQTAADFEALALVFGQVVTVTSLSAEAFPPFAVPFTPVSFPGARFTIVVSGIGLVTNTPPYAVPFDLLTILSLTECTFKKQAPENCNVIFRNLT